MIMKFRSFILSAVAAVLAFTACEDEIQNLGTPDISISTNEMTFESAEDEQEMTVTATRDWKVETDADWVIVNPLNGQASTEPQTVTVSVLENTGMDRSADLKFTIGMKSKYLTVSQAGPGGSAEALIVYANDLDGGKVEKVNGYWPYLDQSDVWHNEKGTGIGNLKYTSKDVSIRSVSSTNNIFFPAAKTDACFSIQNLELGSVTSLQLTFDASHGSTNGYKKTFSNEEFKVYVSKDNAKWVELSYDLAVKSDNEFDVATARFTVADTDKLSIGFKHPIATEDAYRLTNIVLSVYGGQDATAIDFSKAVDMDFGTVVDSGSGSNPGTGDLPDGTGEGTLESPYDAAKATKVASALADGEKVSDVYVKGKIKSIKSVDLVTYGSAHYYLTDADGKANFYVYGGKYLNNTKFTSADQIKVGDEVVVFGDLVNYMGNTPEMTSNNYIVELNGSTEAPDAPDTPDTPVEPGETKVVTVTEFLNATDNSLMYQISGTVSGIYQAYDDEYNNISIYISDETGEMLAYRLSCEGVEDPANTITEGDLITVKGVRTLYNERPQMAQGGVIVSHEDVAVEVPEGGVTISFADKANRTSLSTEQQVWEMNGITVTNDKGSGSNIADYSNPARFYKSSKLTVEYPGMIKIQFDCNNGSYATALKESVTTGTVSVSGSVVTVELPSASDSYVIATMSAQVRMDALTVYTE